MDALSVVSVAGAGASGAAAARPSPYLEDSSNTVTDTFERLSETLKVKACGCRSRFCPRCCMTLGYKLRDRLVEILRTFNTIYMITLTVDPWLFVQENSPCPELGYFYVRDKRCVARFVKTLLGWGFLQSDRYFYVVEWQKNGFPHYHLVVDAKFVPFEAICKAWNAFRPPWAGPVAGDRPGMGSVQFTKSKCNRTRDALGCAKYIIKYLTKHPERGYPDWVMDADYRIRRFSSSRGFWGGHQGPRDSEDWAGTEDVTAVEMEEGESIIETEKPMTIRERVAFCGKVSNVFKVIELVNVVTGEVKEREEFACVIGHPLAEIAERIKTFQAPNPYVLVVTDDLARLHLGELMPRLGGSHEAE